MVIVCFVFVHKHLMSGFIIKLASHLTTPVSSKMQFVCVTLYPVLFWVYLIAPLQISLILIGLAEQRIINVAQAVYSQGT